MANKNKTWTPNETQTAFLEALKANGGKATLLELNYFKGYHFKTGSVNTLIKKGLVTADEDVTVEAAVVYNDVKIGSAKKTYKVYALVNAD